MANMLAPWFTVTVNRDSTKNLTIHAHVFNDIEQLSKYIHELEAAKALLPLRKSDAK